MRRSPTPNSERNDFYMDPSMIIDSLWVLLFGMAGVFVVMLIIMATLILLHRFCKIPGKSKPEQAE